MSADDWLHCSVCGGVPKEFKDRKLSDFYGKVSEGEYERIKQAHKNAQESRTVRVDYEYTLNADGTISLDLGAESAN